MRRTARVALSVMVVVAFAAGPVAPAHAATTRLRCVLAAAITFSPGISAVATPQAFTATGTLACARKPAGALQGPITLTGTTGFFDDCVEGAGSGTFSAALRGKAPASAPQVTGRFTFLRNATQIDANLSLTNNDSGLGELHGAFVPDPGQTCATVPVTSGTLVAAVMLDGTIQ